jgi:hypothetical protein
MNETTVVAPPDARLASVAEVLRLVATRLHRDHECRRGGTTCAACRQPWPCSGRRLAELGLARAAALSV